MSDWTAALLSGLRQAGLTAEPEDVADSLWLALKMRAAAPPPLASAPPPLPVTAPLPPKPPEEPPPLPPDETRAAPPAPTSEPPRRAAERLPLHLPARRPGTTAGGGRTFFSPAARALPDTLALLRALRPLMRRVPSRHRLVLDEAETVRRVAEEGIWMPAVRPARERWLRLCLVVDAGASMGVWSQVVGELFKLLHGSGAFLHVTPWTLDTEGLPRLYAGLRPRPGVARGRSLRELIDPSGRSAVLVLSDCVGAAWYDGRVAGVLEDWGRRMPLAVVQVLPENLWARTALGQAERAYLSPSGVAVPNVRLRSQEEDWPGAALPEGVRLPVLTLEPVALSAWSRLLAGQPDTRLPGVTLSGRSASPVVSPLVELSPKERLERWQTASPLARKLAGLLAAAPVISLPVLRLVREALLAQARQVHEAEVLLGDLLCVIDEAADADEVRYDFHPGVRELLLDAVPTPSMLSVLERVSRYVESHLGMGMGFRAMLLDPASAAGSVVPSDGPFARVAAEVLERLGGDYARLVHSSPEAAPETIQEAATATAAPPDEPSAWVLVTGTGSAQLPPAQLEASRIVGRVLAEEGYGLVVGGVDGVDLVTSDAFKDALSERGTYPVERALQRILAHDWGVVRGRVEIADVVVVIGGRGAAAVDAERARRLGKPILPLADTGGDAEQLFQDILLDWAQHPMDPLSIEDFSCLEQPLSTDARDLRRLLRIALRSAEKARLPEAAPPQPDSPPLEARPPEPTVAQSAAWILVAGTSSFPLPPDQQRASRVVGRVLAEEGYGLINAGWPGVEHVIATTFAASLAQPERGLLRHILVEGQDPTHERGQVIRVASGDEQLDTCVAEASAVILIGGGGRGGAGGVAERARQLGKPVLPLAATGGDAQQLFWEMFLDWTQQPVAGLTIEDFSCLERPLSDDARDLRRLLRTALRLSEKPPLPELAAPQLRGPRVEISLGKQRHLPFVVGVLADLAGASPRRPLRERRFFSISRDTFNLAMESIGPSLILDIPDGRDTRRVELRFRYLSDFHPDNLLQRVDLLKALFSEWRSARKNPWLRSLDRDVTRAQSRQAKIQLEQVKERLTGLLRAILHHPHFRRLEATWRGLHYLVVQTDSSPDLGIQYLDVTKGELSQSLTESPHLVQSSLFDEIYHGRLCRSNGEPFGMLLGDYEFSHSREDVNLLSKLSRLAAVSAAPFVAAASPEMFGLKEFADLDKHLRPHSAVFKSEGYSAWRAFRAADASRYVALTVPRVLGRAPYGRDAPGYRAFPFEELEGASGSDDYLWMSAGWAFAACVTTAYARDGWLLHARGRVEGLPERPLPAVEGLGPQRGSSEVSIQGRRETLLYELGFLPLCRVDSSNSSVFFTLQSCHLPASGVTAEVRGPLELASRVNYLLSLCLFVRGLMVLARDTISPRGPLDCERRLNDWLSQYVCDPASADEEARVRRPLREAAVVVRAATSQDGRYELDIRLRLHSPLEASGVTLQVTAMVPPLLS